MFRLGKAALAVHTDMVIDPIVPLLAIAGLVYLGSRNRCAFLVEIGAAMMVASTIVICRDYGGWPM